MKTYFSNRLYSILIVALIVTGGAAIADCRSALQQIIEMNIQQITDPSQTRGRETMLYHSELGSRLPDMLDRLGPSDHWIDLGAGEAMAQQTYAREKSSHAKLTAIDVRGPSTPTASVKVERGLFFQMDISSIGKADLITDVEGVLGYSILFSEDLSKALSHLKPGGTLMFSMQRQTQDGHPLAFTNKDGAPITAETYFSKIKGLSSFEVDDAGTFVRVILPRLGSDRGLSSSDFELSFDCAP